MHDDENDKMPLPDVPTATSTTGSASARWKKGQSGNPSGRPKRIRSVAEVKELARQHTSLAINTLAKIAGDAKSSTQSRVAASEALLARGWGRAPTTEMEASGGLIIQILKYADEVPEMKVIEAVRDGDDNQDNNGS